MLYSNQPYVTNLANYKCQILVIVLSFTFSLLIFIVIFSSCTASISVNAYISLQKTRPTLAFFPSAFQNRRNRSTYSSAFRNCWYRLTYYDSLKPTLSKSLL